MQKKVQAASVKICDVGIDFPQLINFALGELKQMASLTLMHLVTVDTHKVFRWCNIDFKARFVRLRLMVCNGSGSSASPASQQ